MTPTTYLPGLSKLKFALCKINVSNFLKLSNRNRLDTRAKKTGMLKVNGTKKMH